MTSAIQIKRPEVVEEIRELASIIDQSFTDAVAVAVHAELDRQRRARDKAERLRRINEIVESVKALPIVGPMLTDDDLYGPDGLPR